MFASAAEQADNPIRRQTRKSISVMPRLVARASPHGESAVLSICGPAGEAVPSVRYAFTADVGAKSLAECIFLCADIIASGV